MLLTELSTIKCHKKEKVRDFNQRFATMLQKFPPNLALDNSITIEYYTKALPRDIVVFVKREARPTLAANYVAALAVERDMLSIGAIDHEGRDDHKPITKKCQSSTNKTTDKEKDAFNL